MRLRNTSPPTPHRGGSAACFCRQAQQAFRRPLPFQPRAQLWLQKSGKAERKTAPNPQQQQRIEARNRAVAAVPPDAAKTLAAQSGKPPGLSVHYQDYPQHSHGSLLAASFQAALSRKLPPLFRKTFRNQPMTESNPKRVPPDSSAKLARLLSPQLRAALCFTAPNWPIIRLPCNCAAHQNPAAPCRPKQTCAARHHPARPALAR